MSTEATQQGPMCPRCGERDNDDRHRIQCEYAYLYRDDVVHAAAEYGIDEATAVDLLASLREFGEGYERSAERARCVMDLGWRPDMRIVHTRDSLAAKRIAASSKPTPEEIAKMPHKDVMALLPQPRPLTWDDLLDRCSRLHTTRQRPEGPWEGAELREDSEVLHVLINGHPGRITPTRMHEPGFYAWVGDDIWRSDEDLAKLRRFVEAGCVVEDPS